MGCSNTKSLRPPRNPIEALQFQEFQRERCQRQRQNEKKQIRKLHKKLAKKQKKQREKELKLENCSCARDEGNDTKVTSDYDEELNLNIEKTIQNQLKKDLCGFLLDQVTYTAEFFGNFENELTSTLADFLDTECIYNQKLEEHSVLMANPLDAAVAKWVRFKPIHGPEKFHAHLLQCPVIYIVFENIDVLRPNDAYYDSISPLCKVNMEVDSYRTTPCKENYLEILQETKWKGYVRLKLRDGNQFKFQDEVDEVDGNFQKSLKNDTYKSRATSRASSGYGSDDYTYITLLNTHQPLEKLKMDSQLDPKILPNSCVSRLSDYIDARIFDDNDDEEDSDNGSQTQKQHCRNYETEQALRRYEFEQDRRKRLLHQKYLNSKEFLCYFGELFRQKLAKRLRVRNDDLDTATYRCASIYTRDYEFIPAIHVAQNAQSWPECAFQFRLRERPSRKDPRTGELVQWPTHAMIKQIETFGFHVIPLGYAPKKSRNPFREIEWKIVFPKAERYLERHLSRPQVKILMIMKALMKTFVEPLEKSKSLLFAMDYLRTHMFWECERDCVAWPEEFLGEVLVRFIESFLYRLRHKRMRDYFIEERDLFESIPEYSLMSLYNILSEIRENPLMHLMVAFRNLDMSESFFPKLNFKKIFMNLVYDNLVDLKQLSKNSSPLIEESSCDRELESSLDGNILTGLRRKTYQLQWEIVKAKQDEKSRQPSIESIDVEFLFPDDLHSTYYKHFNGGVENLRRTNLLELLLDHFMDMIEVSTKFGNTALSCAWLKQAKRLTKFLENHGCDVASKEYENIISSTGIMLEDLKNNAESSRESRLKSLMARKIKRIDENHAYEEVIPMDDDKLPPVQKALQVWQNRLDRSKRSTESSPETKKSLNPKEITVDVHSEKGNRSAPAKEVKQKVLNEISEISSSQSDGVFDDQKKNDDQGYSNEAYDESSNDYQTDTEDESSIYNDDDDSRMTFQETSFSENNSQESHKNLENVSERLKEKTRKKAGSQKSDERIESVQIEAESNDDERRMSFKCLDSISIKAVLETLSLTEEDHQNDFESKDPYGISYDISPAHSNDRILDLIRMENEGDARQSKRKSRRAKSTKSRQRRKREMSVPLEAPNDGDCVIDIESVEPVSEGSSVSRSFFGKYINKENILKKFPIISSEMIETVVESKEKVMETLKNQERINQVRDLVKTKTLQLKGALLQSSES